MGLKSPKRSGVGRWFEQTLCGPFGRPQFAPTLTKPPKGGLVFQLKYKKYS